MMKAKTRVRPWTSQKHVSLCAKKRTRTLKTKKENTV
jgi:hypothetical protein